MRTERTTVTYATMLRDGVRETDAKGRIYEPDREDEPFKIRLDRVTKTEVTDGRGRNWKASREDRETVAELTVEQAANLLSNIVSDLGYIAEVCERRILIPEPKEG